MIFYQNKFDTFLTGVALFLILISTGLDPYNEDSVVRLFQQICKSLNLLIYTYTIFKYGYKYIRIFTYTSTLVFLLLLIFYSLYSQYWENIIPTSYVLLSFLFFYIQFDRDLVSHKVLKVFVYLLLIVSVYSIMSYWGDEYLSDIEKMSTAGGNNYGYISVFVLYLMFLLPRNKRNLLIFTFCFFLTLFAKKRGASLGAVIALLFYLRFYFKKISFNKRILYYIIFISLIIPLMLNYFDLFFGRFHNSSSGRSELYFSFYDIWYHSAPLNVFFGHGFYSTMNVIIGGSQRYAHSDFVEVLFDFGLIGLFIYIVMFLSYISCYIKGIRVYYKSDSFKYGFLAVLIFYFVKALLSGVFLDIDSAILMIPLSYYCSISHLNIRPS